MCASLTRGGRPVTAQIDVAPSVGFVALIPNYATETKAMRAALPETVPFADAVFNVSRAAVLPRAFERGDFAQIAAAMDDRLHQPYPPRAAARIRSGRARRARGGLRRVSA